MDGVLIYRFIDRIGKGIGTAPRDTIIAESTESDRLGRAFGFHRMMDTLGAIVGPAITIAVLYSFGVNYNSEDVFMRIPVQQNMPSELYSGYLSCPDWPL